MMRVPPVSSRPAIEVLDACPTVAVAEAEYSRLLGYPPHHEPGERPRELAAAARSWYAAHGRPWVYLREVELQLTPDTLRLDGADYQSPPLRELLLNAGATRAVVVAVSAGPAAEEEARRLWQEAKPDEYFFLEVFGSAVVEQLVAGLNARLCALADRDGLMAVPHYSPGYAGWDVIDQARLFGLIAGGASQAFPEPLEVMASGMLRPKKSLLAVVGLAPRTDRAGDLAGRVPCESCAFSPCQYRRQPYRHAVGPAAAGRVPEAAPAGGPRYTVNARALRKWATERVTIAPRPDGALAARFRFDGTTCSNQGRPLAFDYEVTLRGPEEAPTIVAATCRPAPDDTGHQAMCAYLDDADGLMRAIADDAPLVGRPLAEVFAWTRVAAPAGCHCTAESRAHKWGLALEAIHFTLAQRAASRAAPTAVGAGHFQHDQAL